MSRYFAVYFGAFGFTLVSLMNLVRHQDLLAALKHGGIALVVFGLIGMFFGGMLAKITTRDGEGA